MRGIDVEDETVLVVRKDEQFYEYTYDLDTIRAALEKHGFALESVCDGESFGPLTDESERYFFCAVKQYTQLEEQ